jgi:hypothetical protein
MFAETTAVIGALKTMRDLVSGMKDSAEKRHLAAAVEDMQAKFISLQGTIIETREALATAQELARAAEQKAMDAEDWTRQAERYVLKEITPGLFAYSLKPGMEQGEPQHTLCATCFSNHKKSFLQRSQVGPSVAYKCHDCGASTHTRGR